MPGGARRLGRMTCAGLFLFGSLRNVAAFAQPAPGSAGPVPVTGSSQLGGAAPPVASPGPKPPASKSAEASSSSAEASVIASAGSPPSTASAAAEPPADAASVVSDRAELEHWLASGGAVREAPSPRPGDTDPSVAGPPLGPRRIGIFVEPGLSALGHIGPMASVSPAGPRFSLAAGYEPLRWLAVFLETDFTLSRTTYAAPPPEPRTYVLFGGGAGLGLTWRFSEHLGARFQGSFGLARLSSDVLETYGFRDSTRLKAYWGGDLGVLWFPASRHYAVVGQVGLRNYNAGLAQQGDATAALAWSSGGALRYVF